MGKKQSPKRKDLTQRARRKSAEDAEIAWQALRDEHKYYTVG
jgi:hypothetical protein